MKMKLIYTLCVLSVTINLLTVAAGYKQKRADFITQQRLTDFGVPKSVADDLSRRLQKLYDYKVTFFDVDTAKSDNLGGNITTKSEEIKKYIIDLNLPEYATSYLQKMLNFIMKVKIGEVQALLKESEQSIIQEKLTNFGVPKSVADDLSRRLQKLHDYEVTFADVDLSKEFGVGGSIATRAQEIENYIDDLNLPQGANSYLEIRLKNIMNTKRDQVQALIKEKE